MIKGLASTFLTFLVLALQLGQFNCTCPQIARSLEDLSNNFRSVLGRHIPTSSFHHLVYTLHFAYVIVVVVILIIQWSTKKGTDFHKSFGKITKYALLPQIITGSLLTYYVLVNVSLVNMMKTLGGFVMLGYSSCILSSFVSIFAPTKKYIQTSIQIIFGLTSLYLWTQGQYMLFTTLINDEPFSFHWENNLELFTSLFLNGFNQASNIYFLFTRGPSIDWKSHHARNAIDFTQLAFQGTMYVVGRDGYWFFQHPGLNNTFVRIFIQNILQWTFIAFNLKTYINTYKQPSKVQQKEKS